MPPMHKFPRRLGGLRILISNDDGVRAPGIKVMERIAKQISDDVWVCAPMNEQSGAGHSLSLRTPLWLRRMATTSRRKPGCQRCRHACPT